MGLVTKNIMNREQAVNIIKEIFEVCHAIEGKSLKLLPPQQDSALSHTFQIHVEIREDLAIHVCVENIANRHKLATKLTKDWLIIYKPYP
jgi:hypothetical protein